MDYNVDPWKPLEEFGIKQKIGFTAGAWDLLHAGHILFLRECRDLCDHLIVGLHVDPSKERDGKNKPIQSVYERIIQLEACKYVDSIIPYETEQELKTIIGNCNATIRFLGTDYLEQTGRITGEFILPIGYINRNHNYSTTELRHRIFKEESC